MPIGVPVSAIEEFAHNLHAAGVEGSQIAFFAAAPASRHRRCRGQIRPRARARRARGAGRPWRRRRRDPRDFHRSGHAGSGRTRRRHRLVRRHHHQGPRLGLNLIASGRAAAERAFRARPGMSRQLHGSGACLSACRDRRRLPRRPRHAASALARIAPHAMLLVETLVRARPRKRATADRGRLRQRHHRDRRPPPRHRRSPADPRRRGVARRQSISTRHCEAIGRSRHFDGPWRRSNPGFSAATGLLRFARNDETHPPPRSGGGGPREAWWRGHAAVRHPRTDGAGLAADAPSTTLLAGWVPFPATRGRMVKCSKLFQPRRVITKAAPGRTAHAHAAARGKTRPARPHADIRTKDLVIAGFTPARAGENPEWLFVVIRGCSWIGDRTSPISPPPAAGSCWRRFSPPCRPRSSPIPRTRSIRRKPRCNCPINMCGSRPCQRAAAIGRDGGGIRRHRQARAVVVLIKWYPGFMSAPHTYVTDRLCFVISGTWWVNSGEDFEPEATVPVPAGGFVRRVAHTPHYDGVQERRQRARRHRHFRRGPDPVQSHRSGKAAGAGGVGENRRRYLPVIKTPSVCPPAAG